MVEKTGNGFKLSLLAFILVTSAALISIRSFPTMSEVGWQLIIFSLLAIIIYLIPASLISAELATAWPEEGGVYVWVKKAFGERWGFTAIWLQWFQMTIGMIGVLTFIAGTLSYVFNPALANNKLFDFVIIVVVWWAMTFLNFRGFKAYTRISSISVAIGVFIPTALLIIGGIWYILAGFPVQLTLHPGAADLIPSFSSINSLVLLITFVFLFIGIEMTAAHAGEIENVKRNYPLGIMVVGVVMAVVCTIGALIVSMLVPNASVNLLAGIMQSFVTIFQKIGMPWLIVIIGLMIAIGAIGQVSTWILGPVRGLLVTARHGSLPPSLQKMNKNGIPVNMLLFQAIVVTFWGLVYLLLPGGVNSSFFLLFALTTSVYIVMYFLMFAAAIRLRYTHPEVPRPFKVPGGNAGMWGMAGFGFIVMIFLLLLSLLPPSQIASTGGMGYYTAFMCIGTAVVVAIPIIIHLFSKPEWKQVEKKES